MSDSSSIAAAEQAPLATLADEINQEHRAVIAAANTSLDHGRRAGELLLAAKADCPHGEWEKWLATNFEGSERTAQLYERIAKKWPAIESARQKRNGVADLSLRQAAKLLASPRKPAEPADFDFLDFQPVSGRALIGCANETILLMAAESEAHPGYWHHHLIHDHELIGGRRPIIAQYLSMSIGTLLDREGIVERLAWEEISDPEHVRDIQRICADEAATLQRLAMQGATA